MIKYRISEYILPSIRSKINFWTQFVLFLISIVVIGVVVIDYGFELHPHEMNYIHQIYNYAWWIYFSTFFLRLIFQWSTISRKTVFMTVVLGILLIITFIPRVYEPLNTDLLIWQLLINKFFQVGVVILYAVLELSKGIVSFINKKTNPALLMVVCFLTIILFGTLLLLLPRSTLPHIKLPIVDALFISTSSVCVTGLSPFEISETFTLAGQIIILLLIQIGGLGVMTITSFFSLFFMGGTGLYNQFALKDMVGSDTFTSLISTLLYILGFTFVVEAIGAVCIWSEIHSTMGMSFNEEIFFSIFHSISAFCNAGFSTLPGSLGHPSVISGHNLFFIIISILIVLGGIGFPILMNYKRVLGYYFSKLFHVLFFKKYHVKRFTHLTNINTRIVLITTFILIVVGTILIALLEWNRAFATMPVADKIVHSLFNAIAPRTAGFSSINLVEFSYLSIVVYMLLMWIGGGSQSTAGGIKVNTFAVCVANFISVIKGKDRVDLFGRELTSDSIRRASAIIFGSIIIILIFFLTIVSIEPNIEPMAILFETISAFSTVGSSLSVTSQLGDVSKILLSLLMFIGRVGIITVIMSVVTQSKSLKYKYPKDNVIIN